MDGVIIIDKPAGLTSHDVCSRIKRRLGARKVGHLGTLDPMATGVLPLVINKATKAATVLGGGTKEYVATIVLGAETDTYDREGHIVAEGDVSMVTPEKVTCVMEGFIGKIQQLPPMYSAVKRNGVPLYKLARKGITVERDHKEIEVFGIEMLEVDLPKITFRVACSKGTYVRTLCHDAGKALGCGGHLGELRRTRSGSFTLDCAVSLEASRQALEDALIPLSVLPGIGDGGAGDDGGSSDEVLKAEGE